MQKHKPTLKEKIEFAHTCKYFDCNRSSSGNCKLDGYAPFDCTNCNIYKKKDDIDIKEIK